MGFSMGPDGLRIKGFRRFFLWRVKMITLAAFFLFAGMSGRSADAGEILKKIPPLKEALGRATRLHQGKSPRSTHPSLPVILYEVKIHHDLILARKAQLDISQEVKGHFEKAVKKAEEKMENEEEDITQSALTKLKLGLAGTLNDISQFQSDIELAKLHLEKHLGVHWAKPVAYPDGRLTRVTFPFKTIEEYFKSRSGGSGNPQFPGQDGNGYFELKKAFLEIGKSRAKLELAAKNRKMTRALLVTEVANYDFGLGNEGDLFEALMIYTRVLVGYYEALYGFNRSVYHFVKINGLARP